MNIPFLISTTIPYDTLALKARVLTVYRSLAALDSLEPKPSTNELFYELVSLILHSRGHEYLAAFTEQDIMHIRALAMHGELLLETYWSELVCTSDDAWATLTSFPYYQNYLDMAALEYPFLTGAEVTFVGSGPLPLSAIVLAKDYGIRCVGIERDREAYTASVKLIKRLGLDTSISIVHADLLDVDPVPGSAVILGAAVGATHEEKHTFMRLLSERVTPGTIILARTADDLVQLLYATVPDEPVPGLTLLASKLPPPSLVNSLAVYRSYSI